MNFIDEKTLKTLMARGFEDFPETQLLLDWPALLGYLALPPLFDHFFSLDQDNPLFKHAVLTLSSFEDTSAIHQLFDQLFVECLNHVKAIPQINPEELLARIVEKKEIPPLSHSLTYYQKRLRKDPTSLMHDLILYLAWDRVCVNAAIIFELAPSENDIGAGLECLKECLIESFQHITNHGRTSPSFFRLLEALFAFDMREDRLNLHTEEEWAILCKGGSALKSRENLIDVPYIDQAVVAKGRILPPLRVYTVDSVEIVDITQALAKQAMTKLVKGNYQWQFELAPVEIIHPIGS